MDLRTPLLLLLLLTSACRYSPSTPPARTLPLAEMPAIDTGTLLTDVRKLASDEFGGRAPGSPGEELTVNYLVERFKAAGAEPGNPDGTWVQKVPLVSLTPKGHSPLLVKGGARRTTFKPRDQVVAFSQRVTDAISVNDSEIVFVGYGVQAPEYQWDDFKGLDVKGKTLIVLVNDPPVPAPTDSRTPTDPRTHGPTDLDPKTFGGRAMTYYGRWTYKYDKAAELGAAAVFIVHETGPAGYPFNVVQGFGDERFNLVTPDKNMGRAAIQGWLSLEAATSLLKAAGHDFQTLKTEARTREFRPVALGATASMSFTQAMRAVDSRNVVAKISGADPALKNEYVVYTAHWDHFGTGTPVKGDAIYNGARDNATGTAMLISLAQAFKHVQPAPRRTIVLLAVTAEEQGLLGSEYYATFPLYPLDKTLANINLDALNIWGRTKDLTIVGLGNSDLDTYARQAAEEQGRVLRPDAEPEKGFYYRSDHFNFAKVGVPALNPDEGVDFVGKPAGFGQQKREEYTTSAYHQPSDEVKDDWNLEGAAEDGRLSFAVGYRVANAEQYPQWAPGSEFRAVRERMLKESGTR